MYFSNRAPDLPVMTTARGPSSGNQQPALNRTTPGGVLLLEPE